MSHNNLTNEQKLDEIYQIVVANERRRMQAMIGGIVKWGVILFFAGFVATHPEQIIQQITEYMKPIIMDQVKTMMDENQENLMESVKNILPTGQMGGQY